MNDMRDTRILEAFEYIDPKYINEVGAGLKLRSVYTTEENTKTTFRTHFKQLATLAACVLLLSLAIPWLSRLPEIINSLASGWGDGSETSEEVESTGEYNSEIPSELKIQLPKKPGSVELSEEEMRQIAWAYIKDQHSLDEWLNWTYSVRCYAKSDGIYAVIIDCSGLYTTDDIYRHIVNDIEFVYSYGSNRLCIYTDGVLYSLESAFENGIIDEEYILSIDWLKYAFFAYTQTSYPVELDTNEIFWIVKTYSRMYDTAGDKGLHYTVRCYGAFRSPEKYIYVVDLKREGYDYKEETVREAVNGLIFEYPAERAILVYPGESDEFYSLTEAFESGMLTAEELKEVYDIYTSSK